MLQQPARSCSSASVVHFAASTNIFQPVPSRQSFKQEVPTHAALQHGGSTITSTTMGNQYSTSSSASPWELRLLQTTISAPSPPWLITPSPSSFRSPHSLKSSYIIITFYIFLHIFTSFSLNKSLLFLWFLMFLYSKTLLFLSFFWTFTLMYIDLRNSTQLHCATGTIATFSMNKYWDLRSIEIISLTFSMQFLLQFTDRSDLFSMN